MRAVALAALAALGAHAAKLQLLHGSDFEGGHPQAPNFAALVWKFQDNNTLKLSGGDNWLQGPFYSAGDDASVAPALQLYGKMPNASENGGRADQAILNIMELHASGIGNHEFDAGTAQVANILAPAANSKKTVINWFGAQYPILSANLDYSNNTDLGKFFTPNITNHTAYIGDIQGNVSVVEKMHKITPATTVTLANGDLYCIVGGTTPMVETISSTGTVIARQPGRKTTNMTEYAKVLQPEIDRAVEQSGCKRVILIDHIQELYLDEELMTKLGKVDIILSAGSHLVLADDEDLKRNALWPEDKPFKTYPIVTKNADGEPALIVCTGPLFRYVGRLVVDFDADGKVLVDSIDKTVSGAYATKNDVVKAAYGGADTWRELAFANDTYGHRVQGIVNATSKVVNGMDGKIAGWASVYLNGIRNDVRAQETNLGNLVCDSTLYLAQKYDATAEVCVRNAGSIRQSIGSVLAVGENRTYNPTIGNENANKSAGQVSQLDINSVLKFNNGISLLTVNYSSFAQIMEHSVSTTAWDKNGPAAFPGGYAMVSGNIRFSYDTSLPAGKRIKNLVLLTNATSNQIKEVIIKDSAFVADPAKTIRIATADFTANGGDAYPFPNVTINGTRLDLKTVANGTNEQDALFAYLKDMHSSNSTAYSAKDTPVCQDLRLVNLFNCTTDSVAALMATGSPASTSKSAAITNGAHSIAARPTVLTVIIAIIAFLAM